jgi:proteasome assembly chaperone (PAC2) family protein
LWKRLDILSEPKDLRDPVLLVSVSTSNPQYRLLYSQARELGKYLLKKLEFKQLAILYSSAMSPEIRITRAGISSMLSNNFYLHSGKTRDYLLFAGHASPIESEYEYGQTMLEYVEKLGVKELVSIGARWTQPVLSPTEAPKVLGFSSDEIGTGRLKEAGVSILKSESAFYFANVIVPLAKLYGMRGYKLSVDHGEPIPHPKSSIAFLDALGKMFQLEVDTSDLVAQSKELAEAIQKAEIEGLEVDEDGEISGSRRPPQGDDIYR